MSNFRQAIEVHAVQFAEAVVQALRSASLDELMSFSGTGLRAVSTSAPQATTAAPKIRAGRLGRRTADDIAKTLTQMVAVLAQHPEGLRAEQIKAALQLDKREMPKPIAEGLKSGVLAKSGNKRATTYFVGASGSGGSKKRSTKKKSAKK